MKNSIQQHRIQKLSIPQKFEDIYRILREHGEGNTNVSTFASLNDMKQSPAVEGQLATISGYYDAGDGGGGTFFYDTTSTESDNGGTVIKPASVSGAGRWKRLLYGRNINVLWFGAKPDGVTDNLAVFNTALTALTSIPNPPIIGYNSRGVIYVPGAENDYFLSDTLHIYDSIEICGDEGWDSTQTSALVFPTDVLGIHVHPSVGGVRGVSSAVFRNLALSSTVGTDTTKHGILNSRPIALFNVSGTGFSGSGWCIDTTVEGIADLCYAERCSFYSNGEHGIWTKGIDSNQCTFISMNLFGNRRWGIFEQGFLGNTYITPHTNSNSAVDGNPVWAFHNGNTYATIQDHTNKEPGVASGWENYWVLIDLGIHSATSVFPEWNSGFAYKTGGAICSAGAVANASHFYSPYIEGGQAPCAFNRYNLVFTGPNGAGVRTNTAVLSGEDYFSSSSGFRARAIPIGSFADREVTMDALGFSIFPVNTSTGARTGGWSINWNDGNKVYAAYTQNSIGNSGFWITTPDTDSTFFNRSSSPDGSIHLPRGLFLGIDGGNNGRFLGYGTVKPISGGPYGQGDILLKKITGAGDTVLGWRCVTAGSPGTWETLNVTIS